MSAIKAIYNAPIVGKAILKEAGEVSIIIQCRGRIYQGVALLHPEDKDFFSEKVGCNIALSRARIEALEDILYETKMEAKIKSQMVNEVTRYGEYPNETNIYDPTKMFRRNMLRAISRVETLKTAIKNEKRVLANYLEGHAKAISSIKRNREVLQDETN